jgi:hypothetical protein
LRGRFFGGGETIAVSQGHAGERCEAGEERFLPTRSESGDRLRAPAPHKSGRKKKPGRSARNDSGGAGFMSELKLRPPRPTRAFIGAKAPFPARRYAGAEAPAS